MKKIIIQVICVFSIILNILFIISVNTSKSNINNNYILKPFSNLSNKDKDDIQSIYKDIKMDDNYLFLGDSITDFYDLDKYYQDLPVVNSGINGDTAEGILKNMEERVYRYNPSKVFLLIGTNQIEKESVDEVYDSIIKIINKIHSNRRYAKIYVESVYPVNVNINKAMVKERDNEKIKKLNKKLEKYCVEHELTYINLYDKLVDKDGNFDESYTYDGLHPSDNGYKVITKEIKKYL